MRGLSRAPSVAGRMPVLFIALAEHALDGGAVDPVANQPESHFAGERAAEFGLQVTHFQFADFGICRLFVHCRFPPTAGWSARRGARRALQLLDVDYI